MSLPPDENASTDTGSSLLEKALQGETPEVRDRIQKIVKIAKIEPNDPLFLVLAYTGRLELLMRQGPQALKETFEGWSTALEGTLESYRATAIRAQGAQIARACAEMVEMERSRDAERVKQRIREVQWSPRILLPALALIVTCIGGGFALGNTIQLWRLGGIHPGTIALTSEEADILRWALSAEGESARDLWKWNSHQISSCQQDAVDVGVTFRVGERREALKGFCLLWTVPEDERSYRFIKEN